MKRLTILAGWPASSLKVEGQTTIFIPAHPAPGQTFVQIRSISQEQPGLTNKRHAYVEEIEDEPTTQEEPSVKGKATRQRDGSPAPSRLETEEVANEGEKNGQSRVAVKPMPSIKLSRAILPTPPSSKQSTKTNKNREADSDSEVRVIPVSLSVACIDVQFQHESSSEDVLHAGTKHPKFASVSNSEAMGHIDGAEGENQRRLQRQELRRKSRSSKRTSSGKVSATGRTQYGAWSSSSRSSSTIGGSGLSPAKPQHVSNPSEHWRSGMLIVMMVGSC